MEDKSLEALFYGDNEMSGLGEILHMENYIEPEMQEQVVKRVKELIKKTKEIPDFPAAEIATLCDLFIELTIHSEDCPKALQLGGELNDLIQEWYE